MIAYRCLGAAFGPAAEDAESPGGSQNGFMPPTCVPIAQAAVGQPGKRAR